MAAGRLMEASNACLQALQAPEADPRLWCHLGAAAYALKRYENALEALQQARKFFPRDMQVISGLAAVYAALGRDQESLALASEACGLAPDSAQCQANLGVALQQTGDLSAAAQAYMQALRLDGSQPVAAVNLTIVLLKLGQAAEAVAHARDAVGRNPVSPALHNNLAEALVRNLDFAGGLEVIEQALRLAPQDAALHFKRGLILCYLARFGEANQAFSSARAIDPEITTRYLPDWNSGRGNEEASRQVEPILAYFETAYLRQIHCDWQDRGHYVDLLRQSFLVPEAPKVAAPRFLAHQVMSLPLGGRERLALMRQISSEVARQIPAPLVPVAAVSGRGRRLRLGYLSPDYRSHPTAHLAMEMFALHDRSRFEVMAYSLVRAAPDDVVGIGIRQGFDQFHEVDGMTPAAIAQKMRDDGIDLLIDLAGYTKHARAEVMALRPAPVQIAYLGFPGTMGADFIDYAVDNVHSTPESLEGDWHEALIKLPRSHFPFDRHTDRSPTRLRRQDFGLPAQAVVFCCFNTNYKIEPEIFDCWMAILEAVPGSVLWLLQAEPDHPQRLRREAENRGVEGDRLIFSQPMPHAEHMQRYQLADLFLDTFWCNAHTTALEALWQGLPMLTCPAPAPSGRIAMAFLRTLGMERLVAQDLQDYVSRAVRLGQDRWQLALLRKDLKRACAERPLFDTTDLARKLESAYSHVWQRHLQGLPPQTFIVDETN